MFLACSSKNYDQPIFRIGWNGAVETWMKFQTSFYCSNGILGLLRFAIRIEDPHKREFIIHKARTFISTSKINAFLVAAYVLLHRLDEAEKVLANADPPVDSWEVIPVFRLTNALIASRQQRSDFPLDFVKLCLEHTNLRDNEKALQLCHVDWIRMCGEYLPQGDPKFSPNLPLLVNFSSIFCRRNHTTKNKRVYSI